MKEKKELCFVCGFRKFTPTREVSTFPSTRVGEISLEVDPIEQFRFEGVQGVPSGATIR